MAAGTHLIRRGAVHLLATSVRRRGHGLSRRGADLQPAHEGEGAGSAVGCGVELMSEELFEEVRRGRLTPADVKAILIGVARKHAKKLDLHAAVDRQRSRPEPMSGERADRIAGAIFRLLAERGRSAGLEDTDQPFLAACGLVPEEARQVRTTLSVFWEHGLVPPQPWKLRDLIAEHAPDVEPTAIALAQAESAFYRGTPRHA